MTFRPRLDERSLAHIEWASDLTGLSRPQALKVLVNLGAAVLRSGMDPESAAPVRNGTGVGPEWDRPGPEWDRPGPSMDQDGPEWDRPVRNGTGHNPMPCSAPVQNGTGTQVALSSSSSSSSSGDEEWDPLRRVDWPWWEWDGSDDRLAARFVAADHAGHDADCCRTSDFLVSGALDIAHRYLETQRPLTAAQERGLRGAVRVVVACEAGRRKDAARVRRQEEQREQDARERSMAPPEWWLRQQDEAVQRLERKQRQTGQRRQQPPINGGVAGALPAKGVDE